MGDFRELMSAEMDDAAAGFAADDFAGGYGRRVVGRVRRRRTVRAVGVGGASAVAVGALAFGVAQLPQDSAAFAPASQGDCATPWPSPYPYAVLAPYANPEINQWSIIGPDSEDVVFVITPEEVGQTWLVTYPSGATEVVPYSGAGEVRVDVPNGPSIRLRVWMLDGATEMAVTAYSVTPGGPLIAPVGDCYTQGATPTPSSSTVPPSADPSLAASTERATSPFQCGFDLPASESADDRLSVVGRVASADQIRAEFDRRFGNRPPTTEVGTGNGVWATTTGMPGTAGKSIAIASVADPGGDSVDVRVTLPADPGTYMMLPEGMSFVGVRDGVVVARVVPGYDGATPGVVLDRVGDEAPLEAFLLDRSALTMCDGSASGLGALDLYVVAGYDDDHGLTYAWSEVPTP